MSQKFVNLIRDEFLRRKLKNEQYSKRAYARDLSVSSSSLHDIMLGKKKISKRSIEKISNSLGLTDSETKHFLKSEQSKERRDLSENEFAQMSHWYYLAILNLADTKNAKSSSKWIAERLGLEVDLVKPAVSKLVELKLIKKSAGSLTRNTNSLNIDWNLSSRDIKIFHSENLNRAEESIFKDSLDRRYISSVTAAVTSDQLDQIKKETKKYFKKIMKITEEKNQNSKEVYTVAAQVFPQTKGDVYEK